MKVNFRDKDYRTVSQCYRDNKEIAIVSLPTFAKRLREGMSVEEALTRPKDMTVISRLGSHTVEGVVYRNLPAIARAYGFNESRVYRRYFNGHRGDDLIPPKLRKDYVPPEPKKPAREVEIGGVRYESIAAACRALGVALYTYKNRRRTGRTLEECLGVVPFVNRRTLDVKTFRIDGETLTYRDIEKRFDISSRTFAAHIKQGKTPEEAVRRVRKKRVFKKKNSPQMNTDKHR